MIKKIAMATVTLALLVSTPISAGAVMDFSQIGVVRTELPEKVETKVCVNDIGEEHMADVEKFVLKYFDGETIRLNTTEASFPDNKGTEKYKDCNVINYSVGVYPLFFGSKDKDKKLKEFREEEYKNITNFLEDYEGIVVSAAGNEIGDASISAPLARYKQMSSKNSYTYDDYRLFVVGQIEVNKNGDYIHHYADGEHVDFVVPNYKEGILKHKKDFTGTSYAAPVASALIAQLLKSGIPMEDIRDVLGYEEKLHYHNGREYKVLSVLKTIRNAYDYNKKKALNN